MTPRATILAFPIARRGDHVRALAAQMAARPAEQAEKHLAYQLRRKRVGLLRKQLPKDTVERELRSFEGESGALCGFLCSTHRSGSTTSGTCADDDATHRFESVSLGQAGA
jgi:hypothetical protein